MENAQKTAVVIGATGLVGSTLLDMLLDDSRYDGVITLSRKQIQNNHPKHENYQVDLFEPLQYAQHLKGDHLYICTGTTQAKTPDPDEYYRIEHDLPLTVARTALASGMDTVTAISAMGADPDSRYRYNKGKGEMERDIENLGFKNAYFVQPALIGGDRDEKRPFEAAWKKVQKVFDPLLFGGLKKYRTIEPKTIAVAMIEISNTDYPKSRIESDELKKIATNARR
ncbi:NAD-dependent epimerase/dehydratase family protein [Nonlabens ponticola]|uniref:NAD-dependent epimerase/dehydratase family protein n=1 Tax=Nonlabens ponticola TaxID=2496866 RepID=A0A3S9MW59_9FLAO|nr:NAD-dependent epimerase/dehydratase family protein [Nonlabens ponticola]AZQ43369.1 NAD-dependent epimerase/dehydratase family protein [Nonlabens ponticola]